MQAACRSLKNSKKFIDISRKKKQKNKETTTTTKYKNTRNRIQGRFETVSVF